LSGLIGILHLYALRCSLEFSGAYDDRLKSEKIIIPHGHIRSIDREHIAHTGIYGNVSKKVVPA
jgi:hypothetical protein